MVPEPKTLEYAVKFVTACNTTTYVTAKDVAISLDMPVSYTSKIVSGLAKLGILESRRGVGVRLAKSPDTITLGDIMDGFTMSFETPDLGPAFYSLVWQPFTSVLESARSVTVATLCGNGS